RVAPRRPARRPAAHRLGHPQARRHHVRVGSHPRALPRHGLDRVRDAPRRGVRRRRLPGRRVRPGGRRVRAVRAHRERAPHRPGDPRPQARPDPPLTVGASPRATAPAARDDGRMPTDRSTARRARSAAVVGTAVVLLAACTPDDGPEPAPGPSVTTATAEPSEPAESSAPAPEPGLAVVPEVRVDVTEVATGLPAPWGLAALADG